MTATGGFTPYQWILVSGEIPSGISLSSGGLLYGSATQVGQFKFTVKVTDAGNHHAQQSVNLVVSGSARGQVIPMTFFGLHIDWVNTPWPNTAFGAQRFWDRDPRWAQINTAPGVFDWTTMDARVNTTLANHVDILFDLARTPVWAQCASSNPKCGSGKATWLCTYNLPGQGGLGQCFPPADINVDGTGSNQHWIDWVTAVASRYKGRIRYYEIWNEPTAPIMWQGTDPQLVRMAQDARCIVIGTGCSSQSNYTLKGIDPSAEITTPAYVSDTGINVSTAMSSSPNAKALIPSTCALSPRTTENPSNNTGGTPTATAPKIPPGTRKGRGSSAYWTIFTTAATFRATGTCGPLRLRFRITWKKRGPSGIAAANTRTTPKASC